MNPQPNPEKQAKTSWAPFFLCLLLINSGLALVLLLRAKHHLDAVEAASGQFVPIEAELVQIDRIAKKSNLYYIPRVRYHQAGVGYETVLGEIPDHIWRDNYGESKTIPVLINPSTPALAKFEAKVLKEIWLPRYEREKTWLIVSLILSAITSLWMLIKKLKGNREPASHGS